MRDRVPPVCRDKWNCSHASAGNRETVSVPAIDEGRQNINGFFSCYFGQKLHHLVGIWAFKRADNIDLYFLDRFPLQGSGKQWGLGKHRGRDRLDGERRSTGSG